MALFDFGATYLLTYLCSPSFSAACNLGLHFPVPYFQSTPTGSGASRVSSVSSTQTGAAPFRDGRTAMRRPTNPTGLDCAVLPSLADRHGANSTETAWVGYPLNALYLSGHYSLRKGVEHPTYTPVWHHLPFVKDLRK